MCLMANDDAPLDDVTWSPAEHQETLSRRRFLRGTLGAALASAGIYEVIDTLVRTPERAAFAAPQPWPEEQYVLENVQVIMDNGSGVNSSNGTIAVLVHPLHNHVITATLTVPATTTSLQAAQHQLESVLLGLERPFSPSPIGLR